MFPFDHQLSSLFNLRTLPGNAPSHLPKFQNLYLTIAILDHILHSSVFSIAKLYSTHSFLSFYNSQSTKNPQKIFKP